MTRFRLLVAIVCSAVLMPAHAQAAKLSDTDKAALNQAISSCKAEAKGKKIKWLSRRTYVNNCVQEALKERPNINVTKELKNHPDLKGLPSEKADAM